MFVFVWWTVNDAVEKLNCGIITHRFSVNTCASTPFTPPSNSAANIYPPDEHRVDCRFERGIMPVAR